MSRAWMEALSILAVIVLPFPLVALALHLFPWLDRPSKPYRR